MFFRSCHGRDRVGPYSLCDNTWLTDWPINPLSVGQYVNNHNKGKQELGLQVLTSLYFFVPCGKFGSPYLGKAQQPQDQHYPFLSVCGGFSFVWTMVWLPVFEIFNTCTDVDACDFTQGLCGHRKRVCTKVDTGEKIPCCTWLPYNFIHCVDC